jgi:hypothetical protein
MKMSKGPVRLHKVEPESNFNHFYNSMIEYVEEWALTHSALLLIIGVSMLIALFVVVIFLLVGVSATDSGVTYNAMEKII